ncbi:MAG: DUF454 domain-containing protein [Bacteroidia bacterium]|nr:MAG: DUF454 domain-containing protein [Bacteroidia bacterium]
MREEKPTFGKKLTPIQRFLWFVAGSISLGLGILGIPLPLLPTTPFLLLATYCYARSSERFYYWLLNHRIFGKHIRNYRDHRGTTYQVKVGAISLLWITISISAIFAVSLWWVRILLLVIAIGVTIHIASLNTITKK